MEVDEATAEPKIAVEQPPPPPASDDDEAPDVSISTSTGTSTSDDDDEVSKEKRRRRRKVVIDRECLNPDCNATGRTSSLSTASSFVLSFYGVDPDPGKKRKVCCGCHRSAIGAQANMLENLFNEDPVFDGQAFPRRAKDTVVLEDSEEDPVTDTSDESLFGVSDDDDLEDVVKNSLDKLNIAEQVKKSVGSLGRRVAGLQSDYALHDAEFKELERQLDAMRTDLYKPFRPELRFVDPLDLHPWSPASTAAAASPPTPPPPQQQPAPPPTNLPPIGKLLRPPAKRQQQVYCVRGDILNVWKKGTVMEAVQDGAGTSCKVRVPIYKDGICVTAHMRTCLPSMMAYAEPAPVRLQVGTRIIGIYHEECDPALSGEFYSGIVAEPPKSMNRHRYLVFFDDGYASYIEHKDIRVVCQQTENQVWNDIHPNSREFIKKYLMQYPERPMVRLVKGQVVRTEWEGSWWYTRVEEVDASLVRLMFHVRERRESIYRGSTRLEPLFIEMQQQKKRSEGQGGFSRHNRGTGAINKPYVEYTRQTDGNEPRRAVARKSTAGAAARRSEEVAQVQTDWSTVGIVKDVKIECIEGVPFLKHQCGPCCVSDPRYHYDSKKTRNISPLLIPTRLGWKRQFTLYKNNGRRQIYYVAPCGRRLRSLEEVHRYLRVTNSLLEIDFFNFEWYVHTFREFHPERNYLQLEDISYGHENLPASCVNSLDKTYPDYIEYSTRRLPQSDVSINLDDGFLTCCDCTDDCQDKEKCACWQLTVGHTSATAANEVDASVGYVYRRLPQCVSTGIFECNHRCKCRSTCVNRVAQKPLRQKLQVFKTQKRGWGIRALHDIPKGAFICVYVGNLYTNVEANRQGQTAGDEYFAELDFIETLERQKEGYESDVEDDDVNEGDVEILEPVVRLQDVDDDEDEVQEVESDRDDDPEFGAGRKLGFRRGGGGSESDRTTRSSCTTTTNEEAAADGSRAVRTFHAAAAPAPEKRTSTRKFFGKDEDVYIMDAKSIGNIGRYLNHSCNPNVFVQNCFVDTHDIRFPWVAFFTLGKVSAGDELCWDYCYIVDQVKGKEIYCQCGAPNCRGRLL